VIALTAGIGGLLRLDGPFADAITRHSVAAQAASPIGDRLGQANALLYLGTIRRTTEDHVGAGQALEQALHIFRDIGSRTGEATTPNEWGNLHRVQGDLTQAEGFHRQALELARAITVSWDEAHALAGLGRCAMANGHVARAEVLLRQALEIFQRNGTAEATALLADLETLGGQDPQREP
jgi:tetratricopeptide (TPR) repeat protein